MTGEFQIATYTIDVEVSLGDGPRLVGQMFLRHVADRHSGPETLADRLNDGLPFFPLRVSEPEPATLLVGKAQVRYVIGPDLSADERMAVTRAVATKVGASVLLDDGQALSGVMFVESPPGHDRPLDFVNQPEQAFVVLAQPGHECLINRNRIRYMLDTVS